MRDTGFWTRVMAIIKNGFQQIVKIPKIYILTYPAAECSTLLILKHSYSFYKP